MGIIYQAQPFPLLGHNREYAYGLTMFENDDADFYQEENNPSNENQYKTKKGFMDYKIRNKSIKVKDSATHELQIKETIHGPVMNTILRNFNPKNPVAFNWIYTHKENLILDAVYSLSHSRSLFPISKGCFLYCCSRTKYYVWRCQREYCMENFREIVYFQKRN